VIDRTPIEPSMTVEWVRTGVRDWRALRGLQLGTQALDEGAEASLYVLAEHLPARSLDFEVLERSDDEFRVRLAIDVDGAEVLRPSAITWLRFEGIRVVCSSLSLSPDSEEGARAALAAFIDVEGVSAATVERPGCSLFPPRR
jgi:hypothetical protein